LRTIIFSTSLDKIEVTEIGLKSEDSFGCATLGTGVMIAFFHAMVGRLKFYNDGVVQAPGGNFRLSHLY